MLLNPWHCIEFIRLDVVCTAGQGVSTALPARHSTGRKAGSGGPVWYPQMGGGYYGRGFGHA